MATIGMFGEPLAFANRTLQDGGAGLGAAAGQPSGSSMGHFGSAMERAQRVAQIDPATATPPAAPVSPTRATAPLGTVGNPTSAPPVAGTTPAGTVGNPGPAALQALDARERARRTLGLEPAPATPATVSPTGDAIIEGMQKLRGVFDDQTGRLASLTNSKNLDIASLMTMQMEVVRFSLLVEVTSKLTGKSTQAFDTLMKGQ